MEREKRWRKGGFWEAMEAESERTGAEGKRNIET